jgi:uncharacterized protein YkwD
MHSLLTAGRIGALGILAWLSLAAVEPAGGNPVPTAHESPFAAEANRIVARTNSERQASGRAQLATNERLMVAAELHARQMASAGRMAHTLAEAEHPSLSDRARAVGYRYSWLSENIARGHATADDAVEGWMDSPAHRDNMLSRQMVEIGVGVAPAQDGTLYYASVFGSPR